MIPQKLEIFTVSKMSFMAFFSLRVFLYSLFLTLQYASTQEILLESTIVRCSQDEMLTDGTPTNLLQLASSFKSHPKLDLKQYSKCRKKLLITLRVTESSNGFVPNALILIDRAKNTLTHKSSRFGRPIAVKFHQDVLFQRYALKYLYRVNGKVREEVINHENSKNYTGCFDSPDHRKAPTCGYIPGSIPKQIAGFCCSCQEHRNNVQGHGCNVASKSAEQLSSAHCLRASLYWYNVYEISPPTLYQKIIFEVYKSKEYSNGSIFWENMSGNDNGVEVDSDSPMNAAGVVKVTYRPHVEGIGRSLMLFNSSNQRLLFPLPNPYLGVTEQNSEPEPLKGTLDEQILIVPKSKMSPHGATCDHVGTGISAFLNQPDRCSKERGACLDNQPFDLWKKDEGANGAPDSKFRLKSFQNNGEPPFLDLADDYITGFIYTEHTADAPTYVDIEIPADDIAILAPGYNAFIESVLTDTGSEGAKVVTQVINKELVEATFKVELVQCSLNFSEGEDSSLNVEMKSLNKKIGPLNAKYFYLDIHSFAIKAPVYCYIVLVNEYGESIAAREITLKPEETCLCVHTCKCACGENTNVKCEKMSKENIIATGLISAIKTAEQLKSEEDHHFSQKYIWIFHWILVFHIIMLVFGVIGWMQKRRKQSKPETRSFPSKHGEEDDDLLNSSGSSETSDITLYDRNASSHLLKEVGRDPSSTGNLGNTPVPSMSSPIPPSMSTTETNKDGNSGANSKVTFDSKTKVNTPSRQASNMDVKSVKSVHSNIQTVAPAVAEKTSSNANIKTGIVPSRQNSTHYVGPSTSLTNHSTQDGETNQNETLESPRTVNSEPSFHKAKSNQSLTRQKDGPQASEFTEFWANNNNNNEGVNSLENFVQYCVSASSSRTSFGTWHRKRRDQYSAYDFLPEPMQKGSFT